MKQRLLRIENLLLLVPFIMVFPFAYAIWDSWYGQSEVENFSIGGPTSFWELILSFLILLPEGLYIILPLFMMHYFLRRLNIRPRRICIVHVLATVLYILYFNLASIAAVSVVPGWHTPILPPRWGFILQGGPWTVFWILQAAFIIYGFVLIGQWRKSRG